LGAFYFGAGREVQNLVYLGLGTGVGGGVVSEGRLIDGARGMGGELGHVTVSMDGPRCSCGSSGCIEAYCSGWALARDAQALVESDRCPAIAKAAGAGVPDARAVSAAASGGDHEALALLERAGVALGAGIGGFVNTFNPELVVIGGGLARIGELLLGPARRSARSFAFPALTENLQIVRTELDGQAGVFGAAALVFYAGAL
jgi:glucokinase